MILERYERCLNKYEAARDEEIEEVWVRCEVKSFNTDGTITSVDEADGEVAVAPAFTYRRFVHEQ